MYIGLFFAFIALIGIGYILYLDSEVNEIEQKRLEVKNAYKELKNKNSQLNKEVENTYASLIEKKKELKTVSDSLSKIESIIGLAPVRDTSLLERVDLAKVNSEHRAAILQFIPNGSPVPYRGLTSGYGYRTHPTLNRREFHRGIDMKAPMKTPVYATADGIVEYAGFHKGSGFGNLVILEHNYGFRTSFGHLNKVVVKSGQFVRKGTLIAYTGNSGMSSGPHLHYEIRFIQRPLNPFYFVLYIFKFY
jgi:murein DD-endopeptidase MepM/ murein hydrolase activator NlpD